MNTVTIVLTISSILLIGGVAFVWMRPLHAMTEETAERLATAYITSPRLQELGDDELIKSFVTYVRSLHQSFVQSYQADPDAELTRNLWWILDENIPGLLLLLHSSPDQFSQSLREEYIPQLEDIQTALEQNRVMEANLAANRPFNDRDMDAFTL